MSNKKPTYLLFTVSWSSGGDHPDFKEYETNFLTGEQMDNLKQVQQDYGITQWTDQDPSTWESWAAGTGAIVQYRGVHIKPIKIVEQWGYSVDKTGDL